MVSVASKLGADGTPMHDPLAVGAVIDRGLITTRDMWVEVETRGEFTRGETVASRHNSSDRKVLRGDRYAIDGVERVNPNVHVAVESDSQRFIELFMARLAGR
jgi:inosine-uridine nucleoside N-ribohydrolase